MHPNFTPPVPAAEERQERAGSVLQVSRGSLLNRQISPLRSFLATLPRESGFESKCL